MASDRQTIMEVNRSIRNIKTELENLLEKGVIDDSVFDTISNTLPPESSLSGPLRTATGSSNNTARANTTASPPPSNPPTKAFEALKIDKTPSPAPPSYEQTPPPSLPVRNTKPIVAHARALYRYAATDGRDLSFEKDDKINVFEYMNEDWWMGQNQRTGLEGIFPRNYVLVEQENKKAEPAPQQWGYPAHQQGPPAQQNPYNSSVPPMAIANDGQQGDQQGNHNDSKVNQYGKKFGKKLGNAAIFGAGATIGGNIVNSIF
ncbi:SH3 domain-containing protein [Mariannaea sp. PMI_226]|nr:SH3 domain-containing protein [Mariannaea sp. PMI_226]